MQLSDRTLTLATGFALAIAGGAASVFLGDHGSPDPIEIAYLDARPQTAPAIAFTDTQRVTILRDTAVPGDPNIAGLFKGTQEDLVIKASVRTTDTPNKDNGLVHIRTVNLPRELVDLAEINDIQLTRSQIEIDAPSALRVAVVEPDMGSGRNTLTLPRVQTAACDLDLRASRTDGAQVTLSIGAPCHPGVIARISHAGLEFTQPLNADGALKLNIPAFEDYAEFEVKLSDGLRGTVGAYVPDVAKVSRVAIGYSGAHDTHLHAMEPGAKKNDKGHVWQMNQRSASKARVMGGGYMTMLGDTSLDNASLVQIYTLPATSKNEGTFVTLSVETRRDTCNAPLNLQVASTRDGTAFQNKSIGMASDDCALQGSLVLKNVVKDLTVAVR